MTYTPTRETLELAALACGFVVLPNELCDSTGIVVRSPIEGRMLWEPSISKADLNDVISLLQLDLTWGKPYGYLTASYREEFKYELKITSKHAALMEAALKVAAMVGAKMKGDV